MGEQTQAALVETGHPMARDTSGDLLFRHLFDGESLKLARKEIGSGMKQTVKVVERGEQWQSDDKITLAFQKSDLI